MLLPVVPGGGGSVFDRAIVLQNARRRVAVLFILRFRKMSIDATVR
ncbi:hypothetical protein Pan258_19190 [Symmachiella dynata]|nr:hypothetical protein Pan258_19190 [Symmachiella dynata]